MAELILPWIVFAPAVFLEWFFSRRYESRDVVVNLGTYAGHLMIVSASGVILYEFYSMAHAHAFFDFGPYWLDPMSPRFYVIWGALFLLDDLTFYFFHRLSHHWSFLWASHVTHHSSPTFNFSVALRQTWTPFVAWPFWLPLTLLGFDPLMVMIMQVLSLTYQFFLHTELFDLPRGLALVFNTPAHHRVHHGQNDEYVNQNFGGVLILWDRVFSTITPLSAPPRYGVARQTTTKNPLIVGLHGWIELFTKE